MKPPFKAHLVTLYACTQRVDQIVDERTDSFAISVVGMERNWLLSPHRIGLAR